MTPLLDPIVLMLMPKEGAGIGGTETPTKYAPFSKIQRFLKRLEWWCKMHRASSNLAKKSSIQNKERMCLHDCFL